MTTSSLKTNKNSVKYSFEIYMSFWIKNARNSLVVGIAPRVWRRHTKDSVLQVRHLHMPPAQRKLWYAAAMNGFQYCVFGSRWKVLQFKQNCLDE